MSNPEATAIVVPEDTASDSDSAYGSELSSYTTSLSSSVNKYQWENGRRYHSYRAGSYQFPNDEKEQDRYELMHHIVKLLLKDRLYLAPIKEGPIRVLDIGTGTGTWAVEMGDLHPEASVILGNDLSPIQTSWVPPNVRFVVDDVESEWLGQPYDFIHSRYMAGSILDWPRLARQCYENLNPDGWVEFQDFDLEVFSEDGSIPADNKVVEFYRLLLEACDKINRTASPGRHIKKWVEDAGFQNVQERVYKVPLGPWPKDPELKQIGSLNMLQFLDGLEAFSSATFTHVLGWSIEEVQVFLAQVRKDARQKGVHTLHRYNVVWGQKVVT
ncbi:MAG: hypothetical protein M1819_005644 [Sarea resinae]|nr:MAG: hypothetical protein M1819_005644 [Sarea resinae]